MSGRMRTGQVTAGPSREAAYGVALSQEVKVTDRPVTQQVMTTLASAHGLQQYTVRSAPPRTRVSRISGLVHLGICNRGIYCTHLGRVLGK